MNSHHNLDMIFHILWTKGVAPQGSFLDQVFRSILLHRSLEGSELSQNTINLTKEELINFVNDKLLHLIKFLMISVNQSYLVLGFEDKYK